MSSLNIMQWQCSDGIGATRATYLDDAALESGAVAVRTEPEACFWQLLTKAMSVETVSTAITQQKIVLRLSKVTLLALQSICGARQSVCVQ